MRTASLRAAIAAFACGIAGTIVGGIAATAPSFAQQKVNVTVAAGQPPRAIPGLVLITEFFIPEVA